MLPMRKNERRWPSPNPLSPSRFRELCRRHAIAPADGPRLQAFLNELVTYLQIMHRDLLAARFSRDVRSHFEKQALALEHIARGVGSFPYLPNKKPGNWQLLPPSGSAELSASAEMTIPPLMDISFLARSIKMSLPGYVARTDTSTRSWVRNAVRANASSVLAAILMTLSHTFKDAGAPVDERIARGGPHGRTLGPFVLRNLAQAYHLVGGVPAKSADGPFGRFVRDIIQRIGWNDDWVDGQIRPAVAEWRRRSAKNPLLES